MLEPITLILVVIFVFYQRSRLEKEYDNVRIGDLTGIRIIAGMQLVISLVGIAALLRLLFIVGAYWVAIN